GGVHEFDLDFCGGEGHAVQFEIPGFLDGSVGHGNLCHDGLADVGLPDVDRGDAVGRHAFGRNQAHGNGAGPHGRRQVAAVAAPVDEGLVDGDLPEEVIHVVVGAVAAGKNHHFAGARGGAAHAVGVLA